MWSIARSHGIGSEEFWGYTIREITALMDQFRELEEREFLRVGIIASTIANCHRDSKQDPFRPQDFMPPGMVDEQPAREPTIEEWNANMTELNAIFGGAETK